MFSIFNKSKSKTNLDWLGVDIHSHLLPYLDDGCKDNESSVKLINRLKLLGVSDIHITPHVFIQRYPNTTDTINYSLNLLQQILKKNSITINVSAAAEYMIDSDFEIIYKTGDLMTLPNNYILIEMPSDIESKQIDYHLFTLQTMGYKPVLAHPEYYSYCYSSINKYKHYKNLGCLFQMNLLSPTGYYGSHVKKASMKLLNNGMIDLVGSNAHNINDMLAIEKFVLSGDAYNTFRKNPIKNIELFKNNNV